MLENLRKLLIWAMVLMGTMLCACTSEDEASEQIGSIYGIVTELGTAEPMKAIGVELYKSDKMLLKTVTFDDGHFEFKDLAMGDYQVNVMSDEYEQTEKGLVNVEAGRQARIDLQVRKLAFKTHIIVRTIEPVVSGSKVTLAGEYTPETGNDYLPSEVGFVYDTQGNPKNGGTVIKCKVDNETKSFSTTVDDFGKGTYYVQAYAKNRLGTEYGEMRSFNLSGTTVVTTLEPTNVSSSSATLNGRIESVGTPAFSEKGFCYNKNGEPTASDTKVVVAGVNSGDYTYTCTGLSPHTTYYVRAYAIQNGQVHYGTSFSFSTDMTATAVSTSGATNVTATSATLNGAITKEGSPSYSEKGFCYSTSPNPTTSNTKITVSGGGVGNFIADINGLSYNVTYYCRAYAIQNGTPIYGSEVSFKTQFTETVVSTSGATDVTSSSATLNGAIIKAGSPAFTEKGFCYSTTPSPTINNIKLIVNGTYEGVFTTNINSLSYNTTYYYRAYVIQNGTPIYGSEVSFNTSYTEAVVYTSGATNVTPSSATLNGSIVNAGSPVYSERGFCYSTSPNPTINSMKKVVSGTGEGNYTANISGLSYNTTYYYKAYVIQNGIPIYGPEVSFNSGYTKAVVETNSSATDIKYESAKLGFTIKNVGDPKCTEAGICYGTSSNPTIYGDKVVGSISTYLQKKDVTGLQENTTYYYRAYVIQDGEAVYGTTLSFKTATPPSVSTLEVSNLQNPYGLYNYWQVQLNGRVNSVGNPTITGRGFKYSLNGDPESNGTTISVSGSSAGNFSASLSQLRSNTTYYVRAYVKNSLGYVYGELFTFTTGD